MRKLPSSFMALAAAFLLASCGGYSISMADTGSDTSSGGASSPADRSETLRALIQEKSGQSVQRFICDDFDGDGSVEAFALTGGGDGQELTGWFTDGNEAQRITDAGCMSAGFREDAGLRAIDIYELDGCRKCAVMETGGGSGSSSMIFTVDNGRLMEYNFHGMLFRQEENCDFTAVHSTLDASYMTVDGEKVWSGHTWKQYWFYWSGEAFEEYQGDEITSGELYAIPGARELVKEYISRSDDDGGVSAPGYRVSTVYRRGNGVININLCREYEGGGDCRYLNLLLSGDGGAAALPGLSEGDGVYLPSMTASVFSP